MRNLTTIFISFVSIFLLSSAYVSAQNLPLRPTSTPGPIQQPGNPTPTTGIQRPTRPPHNSVANCDACGFCKDVEQVPGNWESCQQCVYPALSESGAAVDPYSLKTLTTDNGTIPSPDPYHYYTGFGCISTQPGEFASQIASFFFSIVGGIAFLFFLYGAGIIATSRSDAQRLNYGKRVIFGSIIGLLFALFSVFIIRFIAQGLGLPGIGG